MITSIDHVALPGFYFAGVSVRTTNENGKSIEDLGELWSRFMGQRLQLEIPGRISDELYGVYMNYQSDHTGSYTALIGCPIPGPDDCPGGFDIVAVPEGDYQVYTVNGEMPQVVGEAWQEIWKSNLKRAYTVDFDRYTPGEPVRIYVAVLPA